LHTHLEFLFFSQISIFVLFFFRASAPAHHASTRMYHSQSQLVLYALCHIYTLLVLCTDNFSLHTQKALLEHSISSLLFMTHHANTCPDHHNNSSSSLAVMLMRSSSPCVIIRFLIPSGSRDSSAPLEITL